MANQQLHQSNLRVNRAKTAGLPNEQIIKFAKAENALQGCAMADRNLPLSTNVDKVQMSIQTISQHLCKKRKIWKGL